MGDLIGALAGYIGGKDQRVTGQIAALPVYKGKLEKPPEKKPKGYLTEKQKQLNAYLSKYKGGDDKEAGGEEEKRKKKKRKVRRGEEPGRGLKIIDEDKGMGGLALAKAKGALRCSPTCSDHVCSRRTHVWAWHDAHLRVLSPLYARLPSLSV